MHSFRLPLFVLLAGSIAGSAAYGQQAISAQAGMVHYIEGSVYVSGRQVEHKFGQFPAVKPGEELRTEDGRAEVLLTPGAFLRVAEHSSIRMVSTHLSDTQVEVLSGSVIVECDELLPDNKLALVFHDAVIKLEKAGLYRLDADWAYFRVYDGEAIARSGGGELTLKKGRGAGLNTALEAERFDPKVEDSFYDWSRQRSGYLAYASTSAAQSLRASGTSWVAGGWGWSPMLDEFTFVPGRGIIYSPYGWQFWSPYITGYYSYVPPYYYGYPYSYGYGGAAYGGGGVSAGVSRNRPVVAGTLGSRPVASGGTSNPAAAATARQGTINPRASSGFSSMNRGTAGGAWNGGSGGIGGSGGFGGGRSAAPPSGGFGAAASAPASGGFGGGAAHAGGGGFGGGGMHGGGSAPAATHGGSSNQR